VEARFLMQTLKSLFSMCAEVLGPVGIAVAALVLCSAIVCIQWLAGPLSVATWVWIAISTLILVPVLIVVFVGLQVTVFAPDWVERHPNGKVRARGPHYHGDRQEHWTFWHEEGWKEGEGEYTAGYQSGIWTFYHSSGKPCARGELDGWSRRGAWEFWDDTGCPIGEAEFLARYPSAAGGRFPPRGGESTAAAAGEAAPGTSLSDDAAQK
jgi:hypothetical protein